MKKILYYVNQLPGQISGGDKADYKPHLGDKPIGCAQAFDRALVDGQIVGTVVCGDNYYNEHKEESNKSILDVFEKVNPDIVVVEPAFNVGRYGMACSGVINLLKSKNIPLVTGIYIENPAVGMCRLHSCIIETTDSVAKMRQAIKEMSTLTNKAIEGKKLSPKRDNYLTWDRHLTEFSEKIGARRVAEMLLKRFNDEEFETELPVPEFDEVEPTAPIADMSKVTIALIIAGGVVPEGNPNKVQSTSAQKWAKYDVSDLDELKGKFVIVHGGSDSVYCNEKADRVASLDQFTRLKKACIIGNVFKYFYTTTGTGTSAANSKRLDKETGKKLKDVKVDGVIVTGTWGTRTRCGATMVKEIEGCGIPIVHMATITITSQSVGANRIASTVAIPYLVDNPESRSREDGLREELVECTIKALETKVDEPTIFKS